jgi:hypothetical protein
MNTLGSLRELLHSHISRFSFPPAGLMFMEKPTTILGPDPGPLDPKGSSDFVKHQLAIDKVLEMVDSVSCEGDDSAQALRKSLVHNIQAHQAYLDNFILENWQRQKAASVALPLEVQHQLPIVLDNSKPKTSNECYCSRWPASPSLWHTSSARKLLNLSPFLCFYSRPASHSWFPLPP